MVSVRMSLILSLTLLFPYVSTNCAGLQYNRLCNTDYVSTIAVIPGVKNEVSCQAECVNALGCSHFTYFISSTEPTTTSCTLLRSCPEQSTITCSHNSGCSTSVTGPRTPSILDTCCTGLAKKACKGELLAQSFNTSGPADCQNLCRNKGRCLFWTQYSTAACLLYASCNITEPCSVCTSGSISPDFDQCMETGMETLLIGGWTNTQDNTGSIELVTDSMSCEANIPELPVGSRHGAATVMGHTLLYCGGYVHDAPHWRANCYTYTLDSTGAMWEEVESMVYPRGQFSMVSYEGKAYAIGGDSDYGWGAVGPTVEVFVPGDGWAVDTTMQMGCHRRYHCSVMINSRIIIIGGQCAGTSNSKGVIEFDLKADNKAWKNLANTWYGRQYHGCQVGSFQGMRGIYAAGGSNSGHTLVEFYVDKSNRWRKLPPMKVNRYYHTLSLINSTIYAHGGHGAEAKQEKFKRNWSELANLSKSRKYHASVSVPEGTVTCNGMDNQG